ncbi:MAG: sugar translocase [Firmicutes bacterium HGW-Firmicutes-15]|nr:MAG: sugar translocase [Firmicutes bacterium HGW-Firmicutes-15]
MSRLVNSVRNAKYNLFGLVLSYFFNFISRRVFILYLNAQYLGLDGLFSDILTMLSLADLGIGSAIAFSLYKPLALKQLDKVKSLMEFYKRAYQTIGLVVLSVGLGLLPFLRLVLGTLPAIPNINLIYSLYVIHSSISYFLSYKRTLLIADQKKYLDSIYQYIFLSSKHLIQIFIIVFTRNFVYFLLVMVGMTILENLLISKKINKLYPYLKEKNRSHLDPIEKAIIKKNVIALSFHKVGAILVNGTDNILIVKFVSLATAGFYSNYVLIRTALNRVFQILFSSITASIGNLHAEKSIDASMLVFSQLNFISAWIFGFSAICLQLLYNPFIHIWIGDEYIFNEWIVFVIVLNFYLRGMRQPVLTFRDSLGLFWFDRYKSIVEALVNLVVSIILVKQIGFIGILIGTTISTITVCSWIEPYVLFKHGFNSSVFTYFEKTLFYIFMTAVAGILAYALTFFVSIENAYLEFVYRFVICLIIPNCFFFLTYRKRDEFKDSIYLFKKLFRRHKSPHNSLHE